MNLRDAAQQALEALELYQSEMSVKLFDTAVTALHAALSDEAMQRLTDVQQEMEQPMTDCHDKEGQVKHQIYEQALKIAKTDAVWWRKKNKIQQQNGAPEFALQGMLASLWLKGFYAGVRHEKSQRGNER